MADLSITEIAIGAAALLSVLAYAVFILRPAVACYGRAWEKIAAGVLTLFMLATLVGAGTAVGLAIFWGWLHFA